MMEAVVDVLFKVGKVILFVVVFVLSAVVSALIWQKWREFFR
jgi:hypothetical protein